MNAEEFAPVPKKYAQGWHVFPYGPETDAEGRARAWWIVAYDGWALCQCWDENAARTIYRRMSYMLPGGFRPDLIENPAW